MPKTMPNIEIDDEPGAKQTFLSLAHARCLDGTRGLVMTMAAGKSTTQTVMNYTEAVKLHEALATALAFLDANDE